MFYDILDNKRLAILPLLKNFKKNFYLAGGTALALQIGHRDSADFDFFTAKSIDTKKLFDQIEDVFVGHKIMNVQEEKNTLTVIIDDNIKLSFFTYKYSLVDELIDEKNFKMASLTDIGCMKLSAIIGRAANKDYIDLYYILHLIKLDKLLKKAVKKFPTVDINLFLKSLVYFSDIEKEKIKFKRGNRVSFNEVKMFLELVVKNIDKPNFI